MSRKLATIRKVQKLKPIAGADLIEVAVVDSWEVIVQKNKVQEGSLVVYFEIDSWIPTSLAPFLSKGQEPKEYAGIKGEKLRTIKLKGQVSQGLIMTIDEIKWPVEGPAGRSCPVPGPLVGQDPKGVPDCLAEDTDVTDILGITQWQYVPPVGGNYMMTK